MRVFQNGDFVTACGKAGVLRLHYKGEKMQGQVFVQFEDEDGEVYFEQVRADDLKPYRSEGI